MHVFIRWRTGNLIKKIPKNKDGKALTWLNVGSPFEISIKTSSKISKYMKYEGEIIWDKSKPDGTPEKIR